MTGRADMVDGGRSAAGGRGQRWCCCRLCAVGGPVDGAGGGRCVCVRATVLLGSGQCPVQRRRPGVQPSCAAAAAAQSQSGGQPRLTLRASMAAHVGQRTSVSVARV